MKFVSRLFFRCFPDFSYSREVQKVRKFFNTKNIISKDYLDKQKIYTEMQHEIAILMDEWNVGKSEKIIKFAMKYYISIPESPKIEEDNQYWIWSSFGHYLSQNSRQELQRQIIVEKRRNKEITSTILGTVTGLLGVILGILSILITYWISL